MDAAQELFASGNYDAALDALGKLVGGDEDEKALLNYATMVCEKRHRKNPKAPPYLLPRPFLPLIAKYNGKKSLNYLFNATVLPIEHTPENRDLMEEYLRHATELAGTNMSILNVIDNIGYIYREWGHFGKAAEVFQHNLDLQARLYPETTKGLLETKCGLAIVLQKDRRFKEALGVLEEILGEISIRNTVDPYVLEQAFKRAAKLEARLNVPTSVKQTAKGLLERTIATKGPRDPESLDMALWVVEVLYHLKQYEEAATIANEYAELCIAVLGHAAELTYQMLFFQASAVFMFNPAQSVEIWKRCVAIAQELYGDTSVERCEQLYNLANTMAKDDCHEEAMVFCKEAFDILMENHSDQKGLIGDLVDLMTECYCEQNDYVRALATASARPVPNPVIAQIAAGRIADAESALAEADRFVEKGELSEHAAEIFKQFLLEKSMPLENTTV